MSLMSIVRTDYEEKLKSDTEEKVKSDTEEKVKSDTEGKRKSDKESEPVIDKFKISEPVPEYLMYLPMLYHCHYFQKAENAFPCFFKEDELYAVLDSIEKWEKEDNPVGMGTKDDYLDYCCRRLVRFAFPESAFRMQTQPEFAHDFFENLLEFEANYKERLHKEIRYYLKVLSPELFEPDFERKIDEFKCDPDEVLEILSLFKSIRFCHHYGLHSIYDIVDKSRMEMLEKVFYDLFDYEAYWKQRVMRIYNLYH